MEKSGDLQKSRYRGAGWCCHFWVKERKLWESRSFFCLGCNFSATSKSCHFFPSFSKWWLRKPLKSTSTFHYPASGTDMGIIAVQAGWSGRPRLKCVLSPCQPRRSHTISVLASLVLHIHIFLTQTIPSFNTWRLQSKPFVHTRSGNTLNNRPVS